MMSRYQTHSVLGIQLALETSRKLMWCLSRQSRGRASLLPPQPSILAGTRSTASDEKVDEPSGSTGRAVGVCDAEASTRQQRMPCGSRSARHTFSS